MSALEVLATAEAAGVTLVLEGDRIFVEATPLPPADVVARLRVVKADVLHILVCREAARAALMADPPPDALERRWAVAMGGLHRFVRDGWGDRAALLGWTAAELYRVPALWSQIYLTGCALLVGDKRVVAVTEDNIMVEASTGSRNKFRRIGREHVA